ncbi:MAG TPA: oligopeptide/dipeptide ABC transporter ATP-binding protein [Ktedonobacterales bacterium]
MSTEPLPARGEIPSLITPPTGCRFHPRCPHAMPVCRERFPGRTDLGHGHWTHCFLYGEGHTALHSQSEPAAEQPAPEDISHQ